MPNNNSEAMHDADDLVAVGKFLEPIDAQMAKGLLEAVGIECFLQGENANSLLAAAFPARLLVHKADEQAATDVLNSHEDHAADALQAEQAEEKDHDSGE